MKGKLSKFLFLLAIEIAVSLNLFFSSELQINAIENEIEDSLKNQAENIIKNTASNKGCNIAIALDVSGSMVATDENRLSIEMIEMLIDLCGEEDSIAVVAYDDFIVYQSELVSMSDSNSREQLKAEIKQLEFRGETDNGLGLKTAVDILIKDNSAKKSYVLFISDGKTDLANSQSERTMEQSQDDWETSCNIAKEKGIQIHTISFVNEYSEDTTEMTIASEKTGGLSSVVANPLQFTKAIVQTWFAYQGQNNIEVHTEDTTEELTKLEIDTRLIQSDEMTFMAVATENLTGFEMFSSQDEITLTKNSHYAVAKIKNPSKDSLYAMFSSNQKGYLSWSLMDSGEIPVVEEEPQQPEVIPSPPVAKGTMEEDLYISKGIQTFDISTLFEDADGDIVKYEIEFQHDIQKEITNEAINETTDETQNNNPKKVSKDIQLEAKLQGTMLTVTPKSYEEVTMVITATDAAGLEAKAEIIFNCIPIWKEYYSLLVWLIVAVILIITGVICFVIYRFFFRKEEAKVAGFSGVLCARFVDLKSKNDIPSLQFHLADYPPEEISLKALLESIGVHEDLPDLENVHFAPYKKNQIRFAHDTKGGVFIGDDSLAAGKVTVIETGTTIYISFAENASEYELRYLAKGMA